MFRKTLCFLFALLFVFNFSSCSRNPHEVFDALKDLKGKWKSEGNIVVYEKWKHTADSSISGLRYALNGKDTLIISNFVVRFKNGDLHLERIIPGDKSFMYYFKKADGSRVVFENTRKRYPFRIILDYPEDSIYKYRQENIRGNKPVAFTMKRIK